MKNINKITALDKSLNKDITLNNDINSDWIFGSSPNMTKGNNDLGITEGNDAMSPSGGDHNSPSLSPSGPIRGSRNKDTMPLDSRIKYENDNSASSCHSGLRAGIQRGDNLMPKAFRFSQSGRSMVEMLGVLAIIGVLSIGGIAGYSYGMNKYRANETINDVNLRAMDVISQLTQGGDPNLSAWATTTSSGYPISLNKDYAPMNYYIKVEKVPFEVCNIISETMPETVEILVDNGDSKCADGLNAMEFSFAGFEEGAPALTQTDDACESDTDCTECQVCQGGYCANLTDNTMCAGGYCEQGVCMADGGTVEMTRGGCTTDADCGDEGCATCDGGSCSLSWSGSCTKNGESGQCYNGFCNVGACTTNSDCKSGYYCGDSNASCTVENPSMCRELNFHKYPITYTDENGVKQSETYYVSNYGMSWWDAKNACAKLNKNMPEDPSEFVLNWDGGYGGHTPNKRLEALKSAAGGNYFYFWTEKLTNNACYAFLVGTDGNVNDYDRNYDYGYVAVCR